MPGPAPQGQAGGASPKPGAGRAGPNVRNRKPGPSAQKKSSGGGAPGGQMGAGNMWKFYTEDSPGIKVGPVPVLVMSLMFIASVFILHIWGKYTRS